jgi:hypothetical protein
MLCAAKTSSQPGYVVKEPMQRWIKQLQEGEDENCVCASMICRIVAASDKYLVEGSNVVRTEQLFEDQWENDSFQEELKVTPGPVHISENLKGSAS